MIYKPDHPTLTNELPDLDPDLSTLIEAVIEEYRNLGIEDFDQKNLITEMLFLIVCILLITMGSEAKFTEYIGSTWFTKLRDESFSYKMTTLYQDNKEDKREYLSFIKEYLERIKRMSIDNNTSIDLLCSFENIYRFMWEYFGTLSSKEQTEILQYLENEVKKMDFSFPKTSH